MTVNLCALIKLPFVEFWTVQMVRCNSPCHPSPPKIIPLQDLYNRISSHSEKWQENWDSMQGTCEIKSGIMLTGSESCFSHSWPRWPLQVLQIKLLIHKLVASLSRVFGMSMSKWEDSPKGSAYHRHFIIINKCFCGSVVLGSQSMIIYTALKWIC